MAPCPMASLICSLSLVLTHLPWSQCHQSDCSLQTVQEPGIPELAEEESKSQVMLLQTSIRLAPGAADTESVDNIDSNFGFQPVEEEIVADQFGTYSKLDPRSVENGPRRSLYDQEDAYSMVAALEKRALYANSDAEWESMRRHRLKAKEATVTFDKKNDMSAGEILMLAFVAGSFIALSAFTFFFDKEPKLSALDPRKSVREMVGMGEALTEEPQGSGAPEREDSEVVKDVAFSPPVDLEEDTFGMSVCSLTRDTYFIAHEGVSFARCIRLVATISLVVLTVGIQVFLLAKVKQFVSARAVHDIREAYDTYELAIYGEENTTLTVNGKHRGIPGTMPPLDVAMKRLNTLEEDDKDDACRIPLSQPHFFGVVLLIWTLTCIGELRKAVNLQSQVIMLETVPDMTHAMRAGDDEDTDSDGIIHGMTIVMKVVITVVMFIPRVVITCYLCYVGCRWLLGTTDFKDLLTNAVALEFILLIKEIIYVALMPARSHLDLTLTKIEPYPKKMKPAWLNFLNAILLFVLANLWVYMYMRHWQQVLPGYNWDVHEVCVEYIKDRFAV